MAIDSRYIPAFSIEDVLLDKDTGAPLSGGKVYFWRDAQRTDPKDVWQITGTSPNYSYIRLPNPMILSSIGTFVDSLGNPVIPYFLPYANETSTDKDYYYVQVLSSGDVPQFTREAVPYIPDSGDSVLSSAFENELSNPQFSEVLFDTSTADYTYDVSSFTEGEIEIAANWNLVVTASGAATVTVAQIRPVGSLNRLTNPGTILSITSSGVSSIRLRQRIYGSPNLWGNGHISASFIAAVDGTAADMTLLYSQSNGAVVDVPLVEATLEAGGTFGFFPGSALINDSTSAEFYPDAYIDIDFNIPAGRKVYITSVMLSATGDIEVPTVHYNQTTHDRQLSDLFAYYQPQINFKPIPSLLCGWDFPLNPAQINGSTFTLTTTRQYIWDQTIGVCSVGTCAVVRNSITGGIQVTTANANQAFYFLQYLKGNEAKKMLQGQLSANVQAYRTQAGGDTTVRVYLYRARSTSSFPNLAGGLDIASLSSNGVVALTAAAVADNWTEIPRGHLGLASGTLSVVTTADYATLNDAEDLSFSGWEITDATEISDTEKFAIIVSFGCPTSGTVVNTTSISLVPGNIPTRPAPQTLDEVVRECGRYFETSFNVGFRPGSAATTAGNMTKIQQRITNGVNYEFWAAPFEIRFNSSKISTGGTVITFYSTRTLGAANFLEIGYYEGASGFVSINQFASSNWAFGDVGENGVTVAGATNTFISSNLSAGIPAYSVPVVRFHYTASSRLGLQVLS